MAIQDPALLIPWAELNGRIAMQRSHLGGNAVVVLIDANARSVTTLGSVRSYTYALDISPDGSTLALSYAVGSGVTGGPFAAIRVASTGETISTWEQRGPDHIGTSPRWRSDGVLGYWRGDTLFTANQIAAVLRRPEADRSFTWSQDNSEVFASYWNEATRAYSVYALRVSNGEIAEIVRGATDSYWTSPTSAARPDSIIVRHTTTSEGGQYIGELWMMPREGTGGRMITSMPVAAFDVSPDGTHVVAVGSSIGCAGCLRSLDGVYIIRLNDGNVRKLLSETPVSVAWGR